MPTTGNGELGVNYLNLYIPLIQDKALSNAKRAQEYQKTFYDEGQKVNLDFKMGTIPTILSIGPQNFQISSFSAWRTIQM